MFFGGRGKYAHSIDRGGIETTVRQMIVMTIGAKEWLCKESPWVCIAIEFWFLLGNTSDQLECESNGTEDAEEGFTRILMNEWALDGNIALEREREKKKSVTGWRWRIFEMGFQVQWFFTLQHHYAFIPCVNIKSGHGTYKAPQHSIPRW